MPDNIELGLTGTALSALQMRSEGIDFGLGVDGLPVDLGVSVAI